MIDVRGIPHPQMACFEDPDPEKAANMLNVYTSDLVSRGGRVVGMGDPVVSGQDGAGEDNTISYTICIVYDTSPGKLP